MVYLVTELVLIALLAGFILLTQYEKHRGVRFASKFRNGIDIFATKIAFIKNHVDFADFVKDTFRQMAERIAHNTAHQALRVTRFVEQQLTRVVRYFRARFAARKALFEATHEQTSESSKYVRTIVDFKKTLRKKDEQA